MSDQDLQREAERYAEYQREQEAHEQAQYDDELSKAGQRIRDLQAEIAEIRMFNGQLEMEIQRLSALSIERMEGWSAAEAEVTRLDAALLESQQMMLDEQEKRQAAEAKPDDEERKAKLDEWWGECVESPSDDELARLEREVATPEWWRDAGPETVGEYIRYLALRGLLERHPEHPEWMRVKEQSDGS